MKKSVEWSGNTRKIGLMYSRKAEIGRTWALAEWVGNMRWSGDGLCEDTEVGGGEVCLRN